jgi:hypothetical protein
VAKYIIGEQEKKNYISILLIDDMINQQHYYPVLLDDDAKPVEPLLIDLNAKGLVKVDNDHYVPTEKGRTALENFMKRYAEYLRVYDIFCAVDLEKGTFAFEKFYDFENDDDWFAYLNEDNWEDVRLAVATFKKLDPMEIVFMSYINEGRFDLEKDGWGFDLMSGLIWDEILKICDTALTPEDLGDEDVIKDIIEQGAALMLKLIKKDEELEKERKANEPDDDGGGDVVETTTTTYVEPVYATDYSYGYGYYEPYGNPYYVSPLWLLPLFLW